jgi:tRNA dimethylallyltransferase
MIIIAGPTASGKSALAMALAVRLGGVVVNADAMQCYRELRVLTARPSAADEAAVPHFLYGVRAADQPANAAWWRGAALEVMDRVERPILCGGTGMYLAALLNGIADVPTVSNAARAEARELLAQLGAAGLHQRLMDADPQTGKQLKPGDSQRVARAWEVLTGTGQGLAYWQGRGSSGLAGWRVRMVLLDPPREVLRSAIEARFAGMLEAGAVEEVQGLLALGLKPDLPLMRAHGVPELAAYLRGEISLQEASRRAVLATHQYTKRQGTWFRHQKLVGGSDMQTIHARIQGLAQFSESFWSELVNFVSLSG